MPAPIPVTEAVARRRSVAPAGAPATTRPLALPAGATAFDERHVPRPRLVQRLVDASWAALALIIAPPGYGKSLLLAEWEQRDPRPFLWITVVGGGDPEVPVRRVASRVAEQLPARPRGAVVVVLDGTETLGRAVLHEVLELVWGRLPSGSTVAIAARAEPLLPVGRLRTHRMLVEVRTQDLAMTPAEASDQLRRAGLELDPEETLSLVRRTEGWPAALYLASLAIRSGTAAADFDGSHHLLRDFVRDEVLAGLPADLREFALRTAMLDQLSGPICDHVLGAGGSAERLARLVARTQLLVPLDDRHHTYRWQRLAGDALRAELRRLAPEDERTAHQRACAWYSERGDRRRAIEHATAAGDAAQVADLLWPAIVAELGHGRGAEVRRWLEHFSDDALGAEPRLALCAALLAAHSGAGTRARHWVSRAEGALERGGDDVRGELLTAIAVIEAELAPTASAMLDAVARASERQHADSQWRAPLCLLGGVAQHLRGHGELAGEPLERGAELAALPAPAPAALCLAVAAMIAIEREDWERADQLADRALAIVDEHGLAREPRCSLCFAAAATARAHLGRLDEAKRDLQASARLVAELEDGVAWYGAATRLLLADASLQLADVTGSRTLLAHASRLARRIPDAVAFARWFDELFLRMDLLAETNLAGASALTIAELRVLRFLPSHRSFREIADQLGVSANTVKTQAHAVYRKLSAASRSEAVGRAREAGILSV